MPDPLDDPTVLRALQIVGGSAPAGKQLCPRCSRRWIPTADSMCRGCADEDVEARLRGKREWWERRGARNATKLERAKSWLKTELRRGPIDARKLKARAEKAGISPATLRRAREDLGVDIERRGRRGEHRTYWSL